MIKGASLFTNKNAPLKKCKGFIRPPMKKGGIAFHE
jgi:hypothetical protein